MNAIGDALNWVFPNPAAIGVWFLWLAASFGYHFFVNNQTRSNKLNNARKYLLVASFIATVSMAAQWLNSETDRFAHPVIIGLFAWIELEIGDWLSYWMHMWKIHPGGVQGWFWSKISSLLDYHLAHAREKYAEALDPAEVEIQRKRVSMYNQMTGEHALDPIKPNFVVAGADGFNQLVDELPAKSAPAHRKRAKSHVSG